MEPIGDRLQRILGWLVNPPADARMESGHFLEHYFPTRPASKEPVIDVVIVTEESMFAVFQSF